MKKVKVEDAVGEPLAHDVIKYGPETKATLLKRGHQVEQKDVEKLKDSGNYFVYVAEGKESGVHEDEAALRMAKASIGENLSVVKPEKGRVRIVSETPGLLEAKPSTIKKVNLRDGFVFAYAGDGAGVGEGEEIASVKIIPIAIEEKRMEEVEGILEGREPVLKVVPPKVSKVGLIVTGTEISEGRIEDAFEPTLRKKLDRYNLTIQEASVLPDDVGEIKAKISEFKKKGFDLILITGGMAVDSEDVIPEAIRASGAKVITRGTPVFPGNMLMVARLGDSVILGVPACVLPDERTSFDIILPRILVGEKLTKGDVADLADGGLL